MTRVETEGSYWLIDEDGDRYCRLPKQEGPRLPGWWDDPTGTSLEDLKWHDMVAWWVQTTPFMFRDSNGDTTMYPPESYPVLIIKTANGHITAPMAVLP